MHAWLTRVLVGTAALASVAGGSVAVAAAGTHHPVAQHTASARAAEAPDPSAESTTSPDTDAAQQTAACQQAGIDPNADNVNYDGQSGVCSADASGNTQQ
jgi:hypothetical protein